MAQGGGFVAKPTLDGTQLTKISPEAFVETAMPKANVVELATGKRRLQSTYWGAGYPDRKLVYSWQVRYAHLRDQRRLVNWLLAKGGTHTLTVWRHVELAYEGDGTRSEYYLPWRHAPYVETAPAEDASFSRLGLFATTDPADQTGLTVVSKTTAQYDGGTPASGELWADNEATATFRVKLNAALADGTILYISMVPRFTVVEASSEQQQLGPVREPKGILFQEVSS